METLKKKKKMNPNIFPTVYEFQCVLSTFDLFGYKILTIKIHPNKILCPPYFSKKKKKLK